MARLEIDQTAALSELYVLSEALSLETAQSEGVLQTVFGQHGHELLREGENVLWTILDNADRGYVCHLQASLNDRSGV